jgi:membrane protein
MSWLRPSPRSLGGQIVETVRRLIAHRVVLMSAALAYYSALSLAPLVVITLGLTGLIVDRELVHARVAQAVGNLLGGQGEELIRTLGREEQRTGAGGWAAVAGVVMLTLAASAVFAQLQDGLNAIWDVSSRRGRGLWLFLRTRLISFAMVFCIGFLLLVSMVANAALSAAGDRIGALLGVREALALPLHLVVVLAITSATFALLFKVLPDARVSWHEAWTGGVLTAVLFQVGAWAIGLYLGRAGVGSAYGAAGSIVVLLVWVFYASLILFSGAEFAHVHATRGERAAAATPDARTIGAPVAKAPRDKARENHPTTAPR